MMRERFQAIALATLLVSVPLAGCTSPDENSSQNLRTFSSISEAYSAVDSILSCEADPAGEPIVPMGDGVPLTSAQKLCFENVQLDFYADRNSLQESYQLLSDSHQGKIGLVQGTNWMVVDFSQLATGQPSTQNIENLAQELNGEYADVGSG